MHWLDYFIIATYIAQIYQICFYAAPSAGSTGTILLNLKRKSASSKSHPGMAVVNSTPKLIGTAGATLAVLTVSMIPLLTILFRATNRYLLPLMDLPPPSGLSIISAGLLLLGNILTYVAVTTLRAHVSFHEFGETTRLYTAGIYRTVRNPITLGLAIIFCGFVIARPSVVMLIGLIIFGLNSHYRIKMEEGYLEKTFGSDYLHYKRTVGKYFPKIVRHNMARVGTIADGEIKTHRVDSMQE